MIALHPRLALSVLMVFTGAVDAATMCAATSGRDVVPLVELYTSEGCDSCPPADRWLSATFPARAGSAKATALAFHVDYWDRLGWKDRFAAAAYTQRQYDAMRANGSTFVYTPQVLVQGRAIDAGAREAARKAVDAASRRVARATLDLSAQGSEVVVTARVEPALERHAVVWLAYADSGLASDVTSGENRGERLLHDHVVRALHGPFPVGAPARVTVSPPAERGSDASLVAFVQDAKSGEVLQTLAVPCEAASLSK